MTAIQGSSLRFPTRAFHRLLLVCATAGCAFAALAADDVPDESVIVTAKRLPDGETSLGDIPASVTVLTRERIERSGARTVPDLLAREVGVVVYDQVGNDLQKTFDLRGFGGSGTAVFLDGARINDPRNNGASLESVPIDAVERIEIWRGSTSALVGGGSEAGVVQIWTRRAERLGGEISAAYGTYGTLQASGAFGGRAGPLELFVSGALDRTDGFRQNSDGHQERFSARIGYELRHDRTIDLSVVSTSLDSGNPGALTAAELASDPTASPFNSLDRSKDTVRQVSWNYRGVLRGAWSLAANAFLRDSSSEALTTGRAASQFGGFFLFADGTTEGMTVQASFDEESTAAHHLAFGVEGWIGTTDSRGFRTPPSDPSSFDRANPDADNTTKRSASALFAQDRYRLSEKCSLLVGARYDLDRTRYADELPSFAPEGSRSFSELSLRGGATYRVARRLGIYASYGEAFLPPTAEQLFAFPGFGSNAKLRPEDSRSYELGLRSDILKGALGASFFRIDTRDEIVFDPTPILPEAPFGQNVNGGQTRRDGVELTARGSVSSRLDLRGNATLLVARFRNGTDRGKSVPLVPRQRYSAGAELQLGAGLAASADILYVGSQVLDNDDANEQPRLPPYAVLDLGVRFTPRNAGGVTAFVRATNALDRSYATRGIFAFDFSTFDNSVFVTPAPTRRFLAGVAWKH